MLKPMTKDCNNDVGIFLMSRRYSKADRIQPEFEIIDVIHR